MHTLMENHDPTQTRILAPDRNGFITLEEFININELTINDLFYLAYDQWPLLPLVISSEDELIFSTNEGRSVRKQRRRLIASRKIQRSQNKNKNTHNLISLTQFQKRYRLTDTNLVRVGLGQSPKIFPPEAVPPSLFCASGDVFFPIKDLNIWERRMVAQFRQHNEYLRS